MLHTVYWMSFVIRRLLQKRSWSQWNILKSTEITNLNPYFQHYWRQMELQKRKIQTCMQWQRDWNSSVFLFHVCWHSFFSLFKLSVRHLCLLSFLLNSSNHLRRAGQLLSIMQKNILKNKGEKWILVIFSFLTSLMPYFYMVIFF